MKTVRLAALAACWGLAPACALQTPPRREGRRTNLARHAAEGALDRVDGAVATARRATRRLPKPIQAGGVLAAYGLHAGVLNRGAALLPFQLIPNDFGLRGAGASDRFSLSRSAPVASTPAATRTVAATPRDRRLQDLCGDRGRSRRLQTIKAIARTIADDRGDCRRSRRSRGR